MSRIANRPLTKPRDPNRLGYLAQVVLAVALLIIPALVYASQRANLHQTQRHIAALHGELMRLEEQRQLLRIELASEQDPRRLSDRAEALTGLVQPDADQVRYLQRRAGVPVLITEATGGVDGHP